MLGTRAARELSRRSWRASLRTWRITTGRSCGATIEDRLAALDCRAGNLVARCSCCSCRNDRSFVHRPWSGLWHNHTAYRLSRRGHLFRRGRVRGCFNCLGGGRNLGLSRSRRSVCLRRRRSGRGFNRQSRRNRRPLLHSDLCCSRGSGFRRNGSDWRCLQSSQLLNCALQLLGWLVWLGCVSRWRFHDNCAGGRRYHHNRSRHRCSPRRGFGNNSSSGWTRGNRWSRSRRRDNGRRGSRCRNDSTRFGTSRHCGHGCCSRQHRSYRCRLGGGLGCRGSACRRVALPTFLLFLLLCRKNRFQRVAGLGDVGEINLGGNRLRGTRGAAAAVASGFGAATEMRPDLLGLVLLQRTGVRLPLGQA